MKETVSIWLSDAQKTHFCGQSLAKTLYTYPLDILLSGELGAGKTTFFQGLGKGLGIAEKITSPTFALEQRYVVQSTKKQEARNKHQETNRECIHIDLYRLTPLQAQKLLASTEDHEGIRCIEWPKRAEQTFVGNHIDINFSEERGGRRVEVTFEDAAIPSRKEIEIWREEMLLPLHIRRHCDAVAACASDLGTILMDRGILLRPLLLRRSAEVHDLLRFLDFRPGGFLGTDCPSEEEQSRWDGVRKLYPRLKHEPACAAFLREKGFPAAAEIVAVHGLTLPVPERRTVEQQILFYADKRVRMDERVTLDERFVDFRARYSDGKRTEEAETWYREAKGVEDALFPGGCPL